MSYIERGTHGADVRLQDGRRLRGQVTRQKIVTACQALMRRGVLRPAAVDVAAFSGVAMRTIFTHFKDIRSLYAHAIEEPSLMASLLDRMPTDRSELFRLLLLRDHMPLATCAASVIEALRPTRDPAVSSEQGSQS